MVWRLSLYDTVLLMVLLVFHASVLESDLDLPIGEPQACSHHQPAGWTQVGPEVELLL